MATNDMKCHCLELFDEQDHKPLQLPCTHTLCVGCVNSRIGHRGLECPDCRKTTEIRSSRDLPVNSRLLDVITCLRESGCSDLSYEGWLESLRDRVARDQKVKEKVRGVFQINENTIDEIVIINQRLKFIVLNNEKFAETLKNVNERLQNQLVDVEEKEKMFKEIQDILEKQTSFSTAAPFVNEMATATNTVEDSLTKMKLSLGTNMVLLANGNKNHKITQRKVSCILEILEDEEAGAAAEGGKDLPFLTIEDFLSARGDDYAVKTVNGVRKFSKIFGSNTIVDDIFVPSLKEQHNIPANARLFLLDHFKTMDFLEVFFDLSARGQYLGRISIKYGNENYYGEYIANHLCLCTGELGPSFVDSNAIELKNFGERQEFIVFGDYERNDGTAGKMVIDPKKFYRDGEEKKLGNPIYQIFPYTSDEKTASQFCILTRGNLLEGFGSVTEGLEILQNATRTLEDIRELKISECGLRIRLPRPMLI